MASANAIARKRQEQHNAIIDNQLLIIQQQVEIIERLDALESNQSKPKRGRPKKTESITLELEEEDDQQALSDAITDAIK